MAVGRDVVLATIAYVLGITAQNTYLFFLAPIALHDRGLAGHEAVVFAASALATMLAVVPAGMLADRFPRRRTMRVGSAFLALAYVPLVLWPGLGGPLVASALSGAGLAFLVVSYNSYVADALAASEMSEAYGNAGALAVLGSAVGPFVGALVFRGAADDAAGLGWSALLFGAAAVAGLLLTLALPHQPRIAATTGRSTERSPVTAVAVLYVFLGASFGLTTPYFALFFLGPLGLASDAWGLVLAAGTVATAAGFYVSGRVGRRLPPSPLLLGGQLLAVIATLPFLFALSVPVLVLAYVARLLFANAFAPFVNAVLMSRVAPATRGAAQGWVSLSWNAGWAAGALAGGALLTAYGGALFALGAAVGVIGVLASLALLRS